MPKSKEDYAKKEIKDLLKLLEGKKKELFDADVSFSQGKVKNVHTSRNIRLEIARIKTAFKAKKLGD